MKDKILRFLEKELKKKKIALYNINTTPNPSTEQIININESIKVIESIIWIVEDYYSKRN